MRPLKALLMLLALGASAAPASAASFDRLLLLQRRGEDHRALGLIKAGVSPDFSQTPPPLAESMLADLFRGLPAATGLPTAATPRAAKLMQLYTEIAASPFAADEIDEDGEAVAAAAAREQQRYRRRLIENLWSVRYLVADADTGAEISGAAPQAYQLLMRYGEPLELVGIEKRYYLPRFYFRSQMLPVADLQAFTDLLVRPGAFRPFQQVAIERPQHTAPASSELGVEQAAQPRLLSESPGRLELSLHNAQPGYLVLAEPWQRSWQALADGQPVPVEIANGFQGAIWLEAGSHHVVFEWPS